MIIAGVDEAGYGPLLGPLVVGCCAFEISDCHDIGQVPCLWQRVPKYFSKTRSANGRKIHVNDSKLVYSSSTGLKELERSVLTVLSVFNSLNGPPGNLNALLASVARPVIEEIAAYPWYVSPDDEQFPLEQDILPIRIFANALGGELRRKLVHCVHLSARVVLERELNRMISATRNKASVLFSTAAIHLDDLLRIHGHQPMVIFCDRQGGREHYGPLLRLMFDAWTLEVIEEKDGRSEYHLRRGGNVVRILFREKAESQCLSVALASMLSKYLREALMRRFNAYWASQITGVVPTAGYYNDGLRFLRDIDARRKELGIADDDLIRSR